MALDAAGALAVRARVARLHEGRLVAGPGGDGDPAVARHAEAIFGMPVVGETATAGRVLVEWVGQPSPYDSPLLMALKARGLLFADERAVLRRAALMRVARVDGLTSRSLSRDRDGYGETYRWGPAPGSYVRAMAFADARRLFDDPGLADEFRLVGGDASDTGPAVRPDAAWLALINGLRAAAGRVPVAADHAALAVRYGGEQGLWKVEPAGRAGYWQPMANRRS